MKTSRGSCLQAGLALTLACAGSLLAEPNPVDFTSSSLAAGPLSGEPGWKLNVQAPANANFVIKPGTGLELTDNTGGTHAVAYAFYFDPEIPLGRDTFDAGMPLSTTANFVIKQEPGPKKGRVLALGWGLFLPVGPNNLPFFAEFARDTEAGGYRLRFVKAEENTKVEGETVAIIPEAALGLGPDDAESDPLQLSLTLTNLGEKTDWESVAMLTNLKTKKVFVLRNSIQAPGVYKLDGFLRGIVNLRRAGEDGLSSVTVTEIDAEPAVDPAAQ
jgi:hypothetical protein